MIKQNIPMAREDAYRLLAACYYPPAPTLLEENCCESLTTVLSDIAPEAAGYATDAARLLRESTIEAQLVEHSRLFLGPFKLVAAPYGSVWLDEHKTVMGDSTTRVATFYHHCGLHLADDFHELPDHFAVELEFMSYLAFCQRKAESAGNSEEVQQFLTMQREFLETFLIPWLAPFTDAIINDGEATFYATIARCTSTFVSADARQLSGTTGV